MIARLHGHVRRLWPRGAFWPIAPWVAYALYALARHDLRAEHLVVVGIVCALAYVGPRSKELLLGLYPIGLVFIFYDAMRAFQRLGLTESRVLLCDLRAFESRLFGSGGNTVHDWFQAHHWPILDVLCAIPYATFIPWCVAGAIWLYVKDRASMHRFMWGFFALNLAGFVTYHVLPAAPPWYFHAHGCTVDLATKANAGPALLRVDGYLGLAYFEGMYAKASSVFGALPSLHCAYPMLLLLEGWRSFTPRMRVAAVLYWVAMVFSSVYLDHHWLLDGILGSVYAVAAFLAMRWLWRRDGSASRAPSTANLEAS